MFATTVSRLSLALILSGLAATTAKADTLFVGSQSGECCFNVDLVQLSSNVMQVTATLTGGAENWASTGGPHPGFAFNLSGDPNSSVISISNISSPWGPGDVHLSSFSAGTTLGTFDYHIDNPGNGANANNHAPLVFDITDTAGISFSSFVTDAKGFYFAADIQDQNGATGESGISDPGGPSPVPEPSSLLLFGSGILGLAGAVRLKFQA